MILKGSSEFPDEPIPETMRGVQRSPENPDFPAVSPGHADQVARASMAPPAPDDGQEESDAEPARISGLPEPPLGLGVIEPPGAIALPRAVVAANVEEICRVFLEPTSEEAAAKAMVQILREKFKGQGAFTDTGAEFNNFYTGCCATKGFLDALAAELDGAIFKLQKPGDSIERCYMIVGCRPEDLAEAFPLVSVIATEKSEDVPVVKAEKIPLIQALPTLE